MWSEISEKDSDTGVAIITRSKDRRVNISIQKSFIDSPK